MKKTILFDLDGTLVDSVGVILASFQDVFSEFEVEYPGDVRISELIGTSMEVILSQFFQAENVDLAVSAYRKYYIQPHRQKKIRLFPQVQEVLVSLRNDGFILGIVTSKPRNLSETLLGQLNATEHFSIIIGSDDVKYRKPHPEPLQMALEHLGIPADRSLFVGDSVHDAECAKSAGVRFVGVVTGTASREVLTPFGKVFSTLTEAHTNHAFEIF